MKTFYAIIFSLFLVSLSSNLQAQGNAEKKEQIAALRVAFITKELSLSTSEAQAFWPLYNELQDKLDAIRRTRKKENKKINIDALSDTEAEQFIDNEADFKVNEAALQKHYYNQFKKVLPVKKVALLLRAEDNFKRELLRKLKEKN